MPDQQQASNKATLGKHAIVIGGSIGGCLTARVLSDYFDKVTIFEADTLPDAPVSRKGVPQGKQVHGLLAGGAAVIRKYFPGIHDDLLAAGAEYGDPQITWRMFFGERWSPRVEGGLQSYVMSRPLLEGLVRKHTVAISNVTLRTATSVSAYIHGSSQRAGSIGNESNARVSGVTLESSGESIKADFVADVSGRNSKASDWIKKADFTPPERTTIGVDVSYVTFEVAEPPGKERDWSILITGQQSIPEDTRAGAIFCVEGGRYLVAAIGIHKDYPPTDWSGFKAFLKGLPVAGVYEEIKELEPTGEAREYRFASYLRRHYERLQEFPEGLIVLGDAMSSINPVYGQGMTVAAKEVEHLDACLKQCLKTGSTKDIAQPFFKGAATIIDAAWDGITVEDFRYPQTRGDRPKAYGLAKWLNRKFFALSGSDKEFAAAFTKVLSLVEPPETLLKPKFLLKAAFAKMPVHDREPPL